MRLLFPFTKVKYYQTVHVGKVRLSTRSYAEGKIADDSNIIFLFDGMEYPGRIRSIFTINDGAPLRLVAYITNLTPLTCEIDGNENFVYPQHSFYINYRMELCSNRNEAFYRKKCLFSQSKRSILFHAISNS